MSSVSEKENYDYWNKFYEKVTFDDESSFCSFIKNKINQDVIIVDIGCGSGRDTYSFAKEGYEVYGIDRSIEAIKRNNKKSENIDNIKFLNIDIAVEKELSSFLRDLINSNKKIIVYSRFFLHSINKETEKILLKVLSESLRLNDELLLEFRTIEDEAIDKIYKNHYRRYIDAEDLKLKLEQNYGFATEYFHKGQGISIYKNEDPFLARMIMKKYR